MTVVPMMRPYSTVFCARRAPTRHRTRCLDVDDIVAQTSDDSLPEHSTKGVQDVVTGTAVHAQAGRRAGGDVVVTVITRDANAAALGGDGVVTRPTEYAHAGAESIDRVVAWPTVD
jgi:hypothetical protein